MRVMAIMCCRDDIRRKTIGGSQSNQFGDFNALTSYVLSNSES
jgi:hypothetical protein